MSPSDPEAIVGDRVLAQAFLRELLGLACPGQLVLCTAPPGNNRNTRLTLRWFEATDLASAAAFAAQKTGHVWFAVGLQRQRLPGFKRGSSKSVIAIFGFWLDVDVLHAVHQKKNLPPTIEAAMKLIARLGLTPTVVVDTGHGLQAYWLFHEPLIFIDDAHRDAVQQILNDFKATVVAYARETEWAVDAVADLARLMRLPGTINVKDPADPRPVRIYAHHPECRYTLEEIQAVIARPTTTLAPAARDATSDPAVGSPTPTLESETATDACPNTAATQDDGLEGIQFLYDDNLLLDRARGASNGRKFVGLWDGDNAGHGNDASAADLALCAMLAFWTAQDAARIDRLFRRSKRMRDKWDEKHSADGHTYGDMTIAKAVTQCQDVYEPEHQETDGDQSQDDRGAGPTPTGTTPTTSPTKVAATVAADWGEPIPLDTPQAPAMPDGVLRGWLAEKVQAVAAATETPPELAAMNAVAVLSTVLQRRFSMLVEPGYFEPLNTYTATILDAGNRKTAVQQRMTGPLLAWEREQATAFAQKIKDAESARRTEEGRIRYLRKKAERVSDPADYAQLKGEIAELEAQLPDVPAMPRLLCEDVTPEHLATLMSNNNERIGIITDEGGLIENFTGRYSGGVANFDLLLKGHSVSSLKVDRGSRPPVYLEYPHLTIGLSVQPDVISGMAAKPGFRGRGVLARFAFVLPTSQLGFRRLETTPEPAGVARAYDLAVRELIDIPNRTDAGGREIPYVLRLEPGAHAAWKSFAREVETWMRPGGRMEYTKDWAGKAPGLCVRLAGLLHCADYASCVATTLDVDAECMLRAVRLTRWLADHSAIAFGLVAIDDGLLKAQRLWREIQVMRSARFKARDVWNPLRGTYPRVADVEPGFLRLMDHNLIAEPPQPDHGKAGRPSRVFAVHPRIAEGWA